jgi:hypothetical protein
MFSPATDADVPPIVRLMNHAYRGAGAAGWSTQEGYLSGDRITEEVLRADLLAKPEASLLKWRDSEVGDPAWRMRVRQRSVTGADNL